MTVIAHIVERFAMRLEEPAEVHEEWFLDWVLRSPKNAGHHLTAGWLGLQALKEQVPRMDSCVEYFGGMGAQALMVQELWDPATHLVRDYSAEAVAHLKTVHPDVTAEVGDAYSNDRVIPNYDLVMLDFGDLTAWKTRDDEAHRDLLDEVFHSGPKAVVFTDIACRYLHLHRERYETLLGEGTCASYETYLEALLRRFQRLYGYTLLTGHWDRWSAVMVLVPQGSAPWGTMKPTPPSPVGLELL